MTVWERWALHGLTLTVSLTGVVYGAMKYFVSPTDPFAVVNHSWQPAMLAAHIVAAPLLVLVVGMMVRSHIVPKLANGRTNRRTGFVTLGAFLVMTMSGYVLQVVTGPVVARATLWLHLSSATFFLAGFTVHLVVGLWLRAPRQRNASIVVPPATA